MMRQWTVTTSSGKEYGTRYGRNNYFPSCDFMLLYPLIAHAGQTEEEDAKQFGVKKGREQSCGTLEIGQYPVHNIKRPAHFV